MNVIFLLSLSLTLYGLLAWAFRVLPRERWQILAAIPRSTETGDEWAGVNLTWYGFFSATAYFASAAVYLVLMGAVGASRTASVAIMAGILGIAIPASRWVARIVERKKETFSVGGAVFVTTLSAPVVVLVLPHWVGPDGLGAPALAVFAALVTAYTLGEGLGRLACISFGCCYGQPVGEMNPFWRALFRGRSFTFRGRTKKISFASQLEGVPVAPVQAVTSLLYVTCALVSIALFLQGFFLAAFLLSLTVSQLWRAYSEFLRADYRGEGRISAYQKMAIVATAYSWVWVFGWQLFGSAGSLGSTLPSIAEGLSLLWNPTILVILEALWLGMFFYTGWSRVTGARLTFHVVRNKVEETW
ncbi:MAG: prolipoprotein diacylglyceryl transferase [Planctomycetes bacterium]|nr:prolipoprotein diacylglyceryl transferase [Planctomycetota bacterium]